MNRIWITWEKQRRNFELSRELGVRLHMIDFEGHWFIRYPVSIWRTLKIFKKEKPQMVFAQNPSMVLALLTIFLRYFFSFRLIIDAHNAGIWPLEGKNRLLNFVSKVIQEKADLTIVTNIGLKTPVIKNNGNPFILPDKTPIIPYKTSFPLKGKYNFLFVCSFAADEPYEHVFEAASELPENIVIYVTGNYAKRRITIPKIRNLILTGFIPDEEYFSMLRSVDGVVVLSKRENCLMCGAYEAVSVGKALILSNRQALRNYFYKGAIFVDDTTDGIVKGIKHYLTHREELTRDVKTLKRELDEEWVKKKNDLDLVLQDLNNRL